MENKISNYNKRLIQELCDEHNKLRKNPECYIPLLRKVLILIRRNNILHLQGERPFKTEGKEAVLEVINYLSNMNKSLVEKWYNKEKVNELVDLITGADKAGKFIDPMVVLGDGQ